MSEDNATRYAQFCQFRRQIRGSSDYVIVGIDVAKCRLSIYNQKYPARIFRMI